MRYGTTGRSFWNKLAFITGLDGKMADRIRSFARYRKHAGASFQRIRRCMSSLKRYLEDLAQTYSREPPPKTRQTSTKSMKSTPQIFTGRPRRQTGRRLKHWRPMN